MSPLLGTWLGDSRFLAPLQVMLLSVPITVLYVPPRAQLERALDFRKIAGIELAGQLLLYALSLPLAWRTGRSRCAGYRQARSWRDWQGTRRQS